LAAVEGGDQQPAGPGTALKLGPSQWACLFAPASWPGIAAGGRSQQ
jgi:hypothetical protein